MLKASYLLKKIYFCAYFNTLFLYFAMKNISLHKTNYTGIIFALLWTTSSIAIKIGIKSASPLTLATIRFLIAGVIMVAFAVFISKQDLPKRSEWKQLLLLGVFNVAIYLGCLFAAIEFVTAGLANLFIAINPILIIIFSSIMLKRKISRREIWGFLICFLGLSIASLPTIKFTQVSLIGILLLIIGRTSYSFASVYYKKINLSISSQSVNAWQALIGGIVLIPFAFLLNKKEIVYDYNLFVSLFWLIFVVSITATLLWLNLVKKDTVNAGKWLFLCPVFGYLLSFIVLGEHITCLEFVGTLFVITGLRIIR